MSVRFRDKIEQQKAMEPEKASVLDLLGVPRSRTNPAKELVRLAEITVHGMRWSSLINLASLGMLFTFIMGSPSTLPLFAAVALAILIPDFIAHIGPARRKILDSSPIAATAMVCGLHAMQTAGWAIAAIALSAASPVVLPLVAAGALAGALAAIAHPAAFILRVAGAVAALFAISFGQSSALPLLIGGAGAIMMSIILRMRFQGKQAAEERDGIYNELVSAYERGHSGWFWGTDQHGRLTYISHQVADQLGASDESLIGESFDKLFARPEAGEFSASQVERTVGFTLGAGIEFHGLIVRAATGEERWWSLSGMPVMDSHGRCIGFLGSGTDLTAQQQAEAQATKLALYDGLTGLPNRVQIRNTLEELLSPDNHRRPDCGLFLLDLDRFKNVNDTLGHPVGDELLKIVAQRLQRVIGNQGQVGRLGGDEFKVIIPDVVGRPQLAELANQIISRLSLPYTIGDCTVQIGATVGIAVAPSDGVDPDELTRNADLALYAAKAAGKGIHRFYQPEMHADADYKRALENELREVLTEQQLSLVYQPIVHATSEQVIGFEALIRWNHPQRGLIPPNIFIPIAEEIGLIGRIGDWVIREACKEAANWPDHLRVAINLSPLQFTSATLPSTLMNALAESGLAPERLECEITEGVFLQEDNATNQTFTALENMGVRLVLDDFGTGYASLGYLKRVAFSKIKIDKSFVRGAEGQNSRNRAIIQAIVAMAEGLGMETVAEGAETLSEIELIRSLGCTQIQGYIFGKPMPAEDARQRAEESLQKKQEVEQSEDREVRVSLLRYVTIHTDGHIHSVRIRNISSSGALVEASGDAAIGNRFELEATDGWRASGEVCWRKGAQFGVRFDEPVDVEAFVKSGNTQVSRFNVPIDETIDPIFLQRNKAG